MSKNIPTGGPAFPIECNIVNGYRDDSGMTLRDWFAGQTIIGLMASRESQVALFGDASAAGQDTSTYIAEAAYEMADAMLAEKFKADEINAQVRREEGNDDLPF